MARLCSLCVGIILFFLVMSQTAMAAHGHEQDAISYTRELLIALYFTLETPTDCPLHQKSCGGNRSCETEAELGAEVNEEACDSGGEATADPYL